MSSIHDELYDRYADTHASAADTAATQLIYRRDLRPRLPAPDHRCRVLDIGCGQGALVRLLAADGYDAHGVDHAAGQVRLARDAGTGQVTHGDFHHLLTTSPGRWDAVLATDVLEHLSKAEVVRTCHEVRAALAPGGVFVARVPNAVSPTGGSVMYSDLTPETWFTARSVAQLAAVCGFVTVEVFACPPVVHGLASAVRALLWRPYSGLVKLALAAETGWLRGHVVTQNLTFVARAPGARPVGAPRPR